MTAKDRPARSVDVEHLFTLGVESLTPDVIASAAAGRTGVAVTGGRFDGDKLRGRVEPPAGDWVTVRADGSIRLDVRLVLRTDDGCRILMTYEGVAIPEQGGLDIRIAPLFETGDARYAWLNRVQGIGIGRNAPGGVTYDVYALA